MRSCLGPEKFNLTNFVKGFRFVFCKAELDTSFGLTMFLLKKKGGKDFKESFFF